jgi:hypothetical protein
VVRQSEFEERSVELTGMGSAKAAGGLEAEVLGMKVGGAGASVGELERTEQDS